MAWLTVQAAHALVDAVDFTAHAVKIPSELTRGFIRSLGFDGALKL